MKFSLNTNLFSDITEIPAALNQKMYPSLNGLRAVSIIMVILHHYILMYGTSYPNLLFIGPLGVDIFFVLSGFLITTLCIKEKVYTGHLSLKNFYIRRALRILPVAYLYILVVLILNYFIGFDIGPTSILASVLFLVNISYFQKIKFDWNLAHFWSVSVEEQFYILLPVFIKKRFDIYVAILLLICFAAPPLVYLQSVCYFLHSEILLSALRYIIKFQGISVGCLFSVLVYKGYLNFCKTGVWVTILSAVIICYIKFDAAFGLRSSFTNLASSILIGFIVVNVIHPQNNLVFKFLNLKILNLIGMLSYSVYIWQQLFMSNDSKFALSKTPLNFVFIIVVPFISYFYYEKYFLKLKSKFIKIRAK